MNKKLTVVAAAILATSLSAPAVFASSANSHYKQLVNNDQGLSSHVLKLALNAHQWAIARGDVGNKSILTVVDFSKPSNQKRMWVINLKDNKVLMKMYVAQGKNSGLLYATRFSNRPTSKESSLGVYTTANTYHGKHGLSMRLNGLEKGINNNAMRRDIVLHPAWYATPKFVKTHDRAGRSWGCFAINPKLSKKYIELAKGKSVIFAYAKAENHDHNVAYA